MQDTSHDYVDDLPLVLLPPQREQANMYNKAFILLNMMFVSFVRLFGKFCTLGIGGMEMSSAGGYDCNELSDGLLLVHTPCAYSIQKGALSSSLARLAWLGKLWHKGLD